MAGGLVSLRWAGMKYVLRPGSHAGVWAEGAVLTRVCICVCGPLCAGVNHAEIRKIADMAGLIRCSPWACGKIASLTILIPLIILIVHKRENWPKC